MKRQIRPLGAAVGAAVGVLCGCRPGRRCRWQNGYADICGYVTRFYCFIGSGV